MGFLKSLGAGAGYVVGGITGGIVKGVGEMTGSKFIQEVGDGIKESTEFAGKQLGNVAEGAWNVGSGLVTKDDEKINQGFSDVGAGVSSTAKAVGKGISATVKSAGDVAGGLMDGDETRWKQGLRDVGKTVAVGALGVSILDVCDVADVNGNEGPVTGPESSPAAAANFQPEVNHSEETSSAAVVQAENPNEHHVNAHWVEGHYRDGQWIEGYWRDGDGDTSVDTYEGYTASNPDYRTLKG
ncbi:hypothetical protein [Metabacillus indicus]|uniref:hypothetical protein n=1 Tax=Metabacillus indicus TaxID=246786 RepID=UPI0024922E9B|nr:hypothetical protein [Metabacillus indicus]